MDASYGERYATLYRRHWWWRAREHFLLGRLSRLLAPGAAGEVLDVGCGDDLFFEELARFGTPWGVETDHELLSADGKWRAHISTEPITPDARQHGRYGLILALDVLEHIADPVPVVQELARRLKPGGIFVATVPAFQSLWTAHDVLNHHVKRYRLAEIRALVAGSGLEVRDARYFFVWLAMLKLAVVAKERIVTPTPAAPRLPPAPLNALLYRAALLEQAVLGDAQPPFGSSAMVIAAAPLSTGAPPSP